MYGEKLLEKLCAVRECPINEDCLHARQDIEVRTARKDNNIAVNIISLKEWFVFTGHERHLLERRVNRRHTTGFLNG